MPAAAVPPAPALHHPPAAAARRATGAAALALALCCALAGAALARQHPIAGAWGALLFGGAAAAAFARPVAALAALPALLPWLGGHPWSGWMVVEEFDLAVLAVAAGGWAARATGRAPRARAGGGPRAAVAVALALFTASTIVAVQRGVADAGGWPADWSNAAFQGYREPLNALRLGKSLLMALMVLPLLRGAVAHGASRALAAGLAAGLVGVSLQALAERVAFPGLLNFSSDYRIVAWFWEPHVGGAALDGFLALTLPFAALLLARAGGVGWALGALAIALGAHTALVTFSRIDYLVLPVGLAVTAAALALQRRAAGPAPGGAGGAGWRAVAVGAGLLGVTVAGAAWTFGSSGYRGLLALLGAAVLALVLGGLRRPAHWRHAALAAAAAALAVALVPLLAERLHKGAYVAYALLWTLTAAAALAARRAATGASPPGLAGPGPSALTALAAGGWVGVAVAAVGVARHWAPAGSDAVTPMVGAVGALGGVLLLRTAAGAAVPWPVGARAVAGWSGAMVFAGAVVGVFGGGAYMGDRLASAGADVQMRRQHWAWTLDLLRGPMEWTVGAGLGRFPERLSAAEVSDENRTGDLRLLDAGTPQARVALTGGRHEIDWGQIVRLSQRIAAPPDAGRWTVSLLARAAVPTGLHLEVCEKQLLYNGACRFTHVQVPGGGNWQRLQVPLDGPAPTLAGGRWWAPRWVTFSTGVSTRGGRLELDAIGLTGADGTQRIANGDFQAGLARWFMSSDHHHMPWHEKNLALFVLLAQGLLGLGLFAALAGGALLRSVAGAARMQPLAPALAGAVVGFMGVGLVDSLLDAPRVAFLFWCVLLLALTLPRPGPERPPRAAV